MHTLVTMLNYAYLVSYKYQINFPGVGVGVWGWDAGLIEIKANSATQLELKLELG